MFYCRLLLTFKTLEQVLFKNVSQRIINLLGTGRSIVLHCQHIFSLRTAQRNAMDVLLTTSILSENSYTFRIKTAFICIFLKQNKWNTSNKKSLLSFLLCD